MEKILNDRATCSALLVRKILDQYKNTCGDITKELFKKASQYDMNDPNAQIPLSFVNELIEWIEKEFGQANLKMIGSILGETAYEELKSRNVLPEKATPKEVIEKLILVVQALIQDPFNRKLQVLEIQNNFARVRRSQTFHTTVQTGIIESFIRKAGVNFPRTRLIKDYTKGPAYDEYEITWY